MVYETRLIFDQLGIGRIDRIGERSIRGNRSSIRSDLAKKAPSRANLEDRIEVQATLCDSTVFIHEGQTATNFFFFQK